MRIRGWSSDVCSSDRLGTAILFQRLIERPVRRIVTASSMSIYGEGLYRDAVGNPVEDAARPMLRDGQRNWEPVDGKGRPPAPPATPEWKRPSLARSAARRARTEGARTFRYRQS